MKEEYAFCPKSGAPLTEQRHYDEKGHSYRVPIDDGTAAGRPDGELTNGELRSSRKALFAYFRRNHQCKRESRPDLYRAASVALVRLKRTADGRAAWDLIVWYALGERLFHAGFDVEWMSSYAKPRCLGCGGSLKYNWIGEELTACCATNCTGDHRDQLRAIRTTVADLYTRTFGDDIESHEMVLLE